jgi:hypothetical protein
MEPERPLYPPYKDRYGFTYDWSGMTAVWVCPLCGEQGGTFWTTVQANSDAAQHRREDHPNTKWVMGPPVLCLRCKEREATASRGHCRTCRDQANKEEAKWKKEATWLSTELEPAT